ncbi:TPA: toll/interleukin-1 receptor domain-containing protein [Photobacterium damselae]|uniref:toll/interleukin-1 receptor domain-containing protein n=1 Tax=Photobacterium damselae TaxID=38293 RepID=UPI001592B098|nr:TIR domain-containing protein [Photobacterium damselae]NVH47202.1 TIR domain-containing protein [Photobacterium damselae subsp. damselae]
MPTYDVVISFAGEDRGVAESIASNLITRGINVFYDEYEQANLWGKDLYVHLTKIYRDESKFCLMVISEDYTKKQWTNHERKAAQARAFQENSEYILPLRLDDAEIEGILGTTGYIDYRQVSLERIIDLLVEKVIQYNKDNGIAYEIVKAETVFERALDFKDGRPFRDSDMNTECPACNTPQNLSEATLSLDDDDTIYTCKNGCQPLLVICRPGMVAWPGRGFRLKDYVIRNVRGITIKTENMGAPILIPASQAALMKVRPGS